MYTQKNYGNGYETKIPYGKITKPVTTIEAKLPFGRIFDAKSLEGRIIKDNPQKRREAIEILLEQLKMEIGKYV